MISIVCQVLLPMTLKYNFYKKNQYFEYAITANLVQQIHYFNIFNSAETRNEDRQIPTLISIISQDTTQPNKTANFLAPFIATLIMIRGNGIELRIIIHHDS